MKKQLLRSSFLALALGATSMGAHAIPVDLELQLLVDVSGSIDDTEFNLQRTGYVNAFNNPVIQTAISNGAIGSIAAQLVYWSGDDEQQVAVDWTQISDATDAGNFATAIGSAARPYNGSTAVQSALEYGHPLFANNFFEGTRLVIDISGDGSDNDSPGSLLPRVGRDNALDVVDTINALVIGGSGTVFNYYQDNVIGGTNAFIETADSFADFGAAVDSKILREIEVPEPATVALMGLGLAGLGFSRRLSRSKA